MDHVRMYNVDVLGYTNYFVTISRCERGAHDYGTEDLYEIIRRLEKSSVGWFTIYRFESSGDYKMLHFHGMLFCPRGYLYAKDVKQDVKGKKFIVNFDHVVKPRHYNNVMKYITKEDNKIESIIKRQNVLHLMRTNPHWIYKD